MNGSDGICSCLFGLSKCCPSLCVFKTTPVDWTSVSATAASCPVLLIIVYPFTEKLSEGEFVFFNVGPWDWIINKFPFLICPDVPMAVD